ncbi:hypothetical protein BC940DRAFT_365292 [Gongronella butleri]|nr:hypothetical protein BC940DRAFT_365292 [Gongronella butleri]
MDRLPNEILRSIFAYLRVNDLVQHNSRVDKDNELSALLPYLERLRKISFHSNDDDLDLNSLTRLFSLPALRFMILEASGHLFPLVLATMDPSMVTMLELENQHQHRPEVISLSMIAKKMPALQGLWLNYFRLGEWDECTGLPHLNCLLLNHCEGCTSTGLEHFLRLCPLVKRLTLFCDNSYRPFDVPDTLNTWVMPLKRVLQHGMASDGRFIWWSLPLNNFEYACMDIQDDRTLLQPRVHIVLQDSSLALGAAARVYVRPALEDPDDQFIQYEELPSTDMQRLLVFLIGLRAGRGDWPGNGLITQPIETAMDCLRQRLITVTTCKSIMSCEFLPNMPSEYTYALAFDE